MAHKVIFLDRDGVINKCAPEHEYILSIDQLIWIPGSIEGLKLLSVLGYKLIIISNQRGIGLGLMSFDDLDKIHIRMTTTLLQNGVCIEKILVCPHDYKDNCDCRKPKIGLFQQTEKFLDIDKSQSYMIGDSESDIIAGKNFGVKTVYIGKTNLFGSDFCFENLYKFSKFIKKANKGISNV